MGGRSALQIEESYRVELIGQCSRPVVEYVDDPGTVGDAEGEVDVGEAVAVVDGERADDGSGDDALILLRHPQQAVAESIPLLDGEHGCRS